MNNYWRAEAAMNASIAMVTLLHFDKKILTGTFIAITNKKNPSNYFYSFVLFAVFITKLKRSANLFFLASSFTSSVTLT